MPKTPAGKQLVARKLGGLIRAARGNRTQQELATSVGMSNSSISRFESGQWIPDLAEAQRLDATLGTGTLITETVRDILFNPTNATLAIPRTFSQEVFQPLGYVGPVYVQLTALGSAKYNVMVELRWGAKRRQAPLPVLDDGFAFLDRHGFRVDETGIALAFAKLGPESVPVRVTTNKPLMLDIASGLPLLDDDRILDVNDGWT
jgi:transcriptional regulator with XRE-family HTH domain